MNELKQLTPGQMAVVDAYLEYYEPTERFDPEETSLIDTQTMIVEMETMCSFDVNMLCDYLVSKGFRAYYEKDDAISGWILKQTN